MLDVYLGSKKAVQHGIEVDKIDSQPIHSVPYSAVAMAREFEN